MKFERVTAMDCVMLIPENVNEAGLMLWLSERYSCREVNLEFNTTHNLEGEIVPRLWIRPAASNAEKESQ
jgi:hypothetical protein